jgi:hypothetical protein
MIGGEGEIRTPGPEEIETPVFETGALNHYATSPISIIADLLSYMP